MCGRCVLNTCNILVSPYNKTLKQITLWCLFNIINLVTEEFKIESPVYCWIKVSIDYCSSKSCGEHNDDTGMLICSPNAYVLAGGNVKKKKKKLQTVVSDSSAGR